MRKIKHINFCCVLLLSFAWLFTACESEDEQPPIPRDRVLLVYMGGDSDAKTSWEVTEKTNALCAAWKNSLEGRLLIYQDDASESPPRLLEIVAENGVNVQKVLQTYEEENSASKEVFARVIREVQALYPVSSYGLLLFSHASGWLPEGRLTSPRSSGVDGRSIVIDGKDEGRNEMELVDFAAAIPDHTFDFIIFEACLMAGIEVAYELKDKTDYILASSAEIVSPGFTDIYEKLLHYLYEPTVNLAGFGKTAFNYINNLTGDARSSTLSLIKTSAVAPLVTYVHEHCDYSLANELSVYQNFYRSGYLFFDFGQYYTSLLGTQAEKGELSRLINDCVVWKAATPTFMMGYGGFPIREHSGLTTYITQERYPVLNDAYAELSWQADFISESN